jgi:glycosyltransferase involved in cell wall biosynthesis
MKIVHVVESFSAGSFSFLSDLTGMMTDARHVIIHGRREDTPNRFELYFPPETRFAFWKNAARSISPVADVRALTELVAHLRSVGTFDALHLHSSKAGFLGRLAARRLGIQNRCVYTAHGVSFLRRDVSPAMQAVFILLEKCGAALGGNVVACSESERDEFLKHNISARVINNGVRFEPNVTPKRPDGVVTVGTCGRITPQKVPDLFNQIAEHFHGNPAVKFLWIGDGDLKHRLTAPNIEVTGWIPRVEAEKHLTQLDIYLSTSRWEGLPLAVLQAMNKAKPLVLSNCPGNRDLVVENYNGFLFDDPRQAVDRIADLLRRTQDLPVLGENSRRLVGKRFTLEATVQGYRNLYRSLCPASKETLHE